jgi:hypothetical protein
MTDNQKRDRLYRLLSRGLITQSEYEAALRELDLMARCLQGLP